LPPTALALPDLQRFLMGASMATNSEASPQRLPASATAAGVACTTGAALTDAGAAATGFGGGTGATGTGTCCDEHAAVQLAVSPPSEPRHVQLHGPLPVMRVALPVAQRLSVGASAAEVPCANPQTPFWLTRASHETVAPPLRPAHDQLQGPVPLTALGKPTLHSAFFGISPRPFSDAGPHTAFARGCAEQVAAWPPFSPEHVHAQGPLPVTALA
jgi:hypothetical protein